MLLTVDVGNTNIHIGVFAGFGDHASLVRDWRIHTQPHLTADELALTLRGLLGDDIERVTAVAALSTVPSLLREIRAMLPRYFGAGPHVLLEPGVRTGLPLLVDNPKEVGTDRVANAMAAAATHPGRPCIVVAFGTATVVDAVSAAGEFLGGAIAPGVNLAVEALSEHTVTVRKVELRRPRSVIGKNTVEALQSGILFGFAGQVDALVDRITAQVPGFDTPDVAVIATGYLAPLMFDECDTLTEHVPHLSLDGLRRVYERSRQARR
ncbi:type III pantothenate kinase [Gordonia hirsuta DSM 44140 = NBRC 16056]|uniref:Type III pantothenate kinase n=1 Tax=Gordonia hirsuta DSM 44140 = NBRC 16056 TaxID=1121927 RepID=L7LCY4_9ACTN|nr:type III pantothenate kinase [Gordonia hirsuta]GAC57937.1 type III pantothenate kinase [Gordonia hirsuta DSM 44140 = NBRC 16056]